MFALLFSAGFSSVDWSVRLSGPHNNLIAPDTSSGSGSMPTFTSGGESIAAAAHSHDGVGVLSRRQSRVLENRDLCRIISFYVPAPIVD